jgi:hypothetical protein
MGDRFRIPDAPRPADKLAAPACRAFPTPAISQLIDALHAAPIRATVVKRAYGSGPVTTRAAGLGLTVLLGPSS